MLCREKSSLPFPVIFLYSHTTMGFAGGSDVKESAYSAGDLSSLHGSEDPLEKGMAIHSGILAWRIPWTEEPAGLQSVGSQRFGHDRVKNTFTFLHHHTHRSVDTRYVGMFPPHQAIL